MRNVKVEEDSRGNPLNSDRLARLYLHGNRIDCVTSYYDNNSYKMASITWEVLVILALLAKGTAVGICPKSGKGKIQGNKITFPFTYSLYIPYSSD